MRGGLLGDNLGHNFGHNWFNIGRVGKFRIRHDRGRIGIDEDDAIALFFQRLDRLRARIIELAGLADDDRPRADDEDRGDVGAFGHSGIASRNGVLANGHAIAQSFAARAHDRIERAGRIIIDPHEN